MLLFTGQRREGERRQEEKKILERLRKPIVDNEAINDTQVKPSQR